MDKAESEKGLGGEIFTIEARRCKRCGGLLTSGQALRDGYGACCLRKLRREAIAKEAAKDQISLFGTIEEAT